jgi:23S rRNA (adenine2030-N6)-methyltransferase
VSPSSRYRPDAQPDYGHRFHAGNVGDVWKHCVLAEVLRLAAAGASRVCYLETHAGEGGYPLGPTGEWTEGIGRLWTEPDGDDAVARYEILARRLATGASRPERYPGSPAFARAVLGPDADLVLWERDDAAFEHLSAHVAGDPHAQALRGDGLTALAADVAAAEARADAVVALVDPPYTQKADWTTVFDAVAHAAGTSTRASLLLWYPVKSHTRPNAMLARVRTTGVGGTVAELVTTPLVHKRNRLNGSGMLLVRPPDRAVAAVAAAAPGVGRRCATHDGAWTFRMESWSGRAAP